MQCGELDDNFQVPRRSPYERGKVPAVVDVAAVTAGATVFAAATVLLPLMPPKSALAGDTGDVGVLPSASPPAPAPGFAAGAARVVDGSGSHTSVMSRSDLLCTSSPLPALSLDVPSPLALSLAVNCSSSAIGDSCCGGAERAEGTCCQVTFRTVSMERWMVCTRMQSRRGSTLGLT